MRYKLKQIFFIKFNYKKTNVILYKTFLLPCTTFSFCKI